VSFFTRGWARGKKIRIRIARGHPPVRGRCAGGEFSGPSVWSKSIWCKGKIQQKKKKRTLRLKESFPQDGGTSRKDHSPSPNNWGKGLAKKKGSKGSVKMDITGSLRVAKLETHHPNGEKRE